MSASSADRNPVEQLAEEFAERYRRGERPPLREYVEKYPQYADEIRELFPALVVMEQFKPAAADATGAFEAQPASAEARTPERLGDYRLLREVGRGGMGVVYEAEQVSLGRHVALKVLPPHALLNPTYLERFRREAKAAARLHHTNIVPVFGVGEEEGVHFYAMQFIRGEGLDRVLHDLRRLRNAPGGADLPTGAGPSERSVAHGLLAGQFAEPATVRAENVGGKADTAPLPSVEPRPSNSLSAAGTDAAYYRSVARVGLQVADALAYAHRQGVIHRDVKPSNLLLDAQGTVWITDFGLAKADGTDELTHAGDIVGTVRFIAPERFDGRSLPQSDVYGLGLTLYELLTLRPAFDDTNKGRLIEKVLHEPAVSPRRLDPRVPRDLETVVLKSVAKDPSERYATAEEMAEDLRRYLADRPIKARRASRRERLWRWARRNPTVASLLGAVATLLVIIAAVSTFAAARLNSALTQTRHAEREARLREAEALIGEAHGTRYSRREGQRFAALAALKKAADIGRELEMPGEWFDQLRNEAIAALALPDMYITQQWEGYPEGTTCLSAPGDLSIYARSDKRGAISVRRMSDDAQVCLIPGSGDGSYSSFSGDGKDLYVSSLPDSSGSLWHLGSNQPVERLRLPNRSSAVFMERPEGRRLVVAHSDGALSVHDVGSGKCLGQFNAVGITHNVAIVAHPNEPLVAVRSYFVRLVEVRDLRTGAVVAREVPPWPGGCSMAVWHPSGRYLCFGAANGFGIRVYAFDPSSGRLEYRRTIDCNHGDTQLRFNRIGDRLYATGWNPAVSMWDFWTGQKLFETKNGIRGGTALDSNGGQLAFGSVPEHATQVGVWSVGDARECRSIVATSEEGKRDPYAVAIHPNGRLLVQGVRDGLCLFDMATGQEVGFVRIPARRPKAYPIFDATGNLYTNSFTGCFRWPVRADHGDTERLAVGPPELLSFHEGNSDIAASQDGRVLAQCMWNGYGMQDYAGGWIIHPDHPRPRLVTGRVSATNANVSPDGRWVAFDAGGAVEVYEAATAKEVCRFPSESQCRFSADGRLLFVGRANSYAVAVGTWEKVIDFGPGSVTDCTSDGGLAVLNLPAGIYRLIDVASGREVARLEDPDALVGRAQFTADGTKLVVQAPNGVRVWDLRRIRQELTKLGLEWDVPQYAEAPQASPAPQEVRVVGAELVGSKPMALNNQAWRLVTGPAGERDPTQALKLILEAVKREPNNATFLNTLGVVLYRNGQYKEAAVTLEKSLAAGKGQGDGFDLFFLAMCHAKLGDAARAKDCFDRAVRWTEAQKNLKPQYAAELKAFRAEAEAVLKGK
jgi:serine/threonine protein kinase/WD40 repeat protein